MKFLFNKLLKHYEIVDYKMYSMNERIFEFKIQSKMLLSVYDDIKTGVNSRIFDKIDKYYVIYENNTWRALWKKFYF